MQKVSPSFIYECDLWIISGLLNIKNSCFLIPIECTYRWKIFPSEYLLDPKEGLSAVCFLTNTSFSPQKLPRGTMVGHCESVDEKTISPFDLEATTPKTCSEKLPPRPELTPERRLKIKQMAKLDHLPKELQRSYLKLLFSYQSALSLSEFDFGCCRLGSHSIPTIPGAPQFTTNSSN